MKLDEQQMALRKRFRELVVEYFWHPKYILMFNVIATMNKEFDEDIYNRLDAIPSIGHVNGKTPIQAWLAQRYNPVATALYNKASPEAALALWNRTKMCIVRKRGRADLDIRGEMYKDNRKNKGLAELRKNMPDRWASSDWRKVK